MTISQGPLELLDKSRLQAHIDLREWRRSEAVSGTARKHWRNHLLHRPL